MASALPRAGAALLLFLLLATPAWSQFQDEEASSPVSLPPASHHPDSVADSALAPVSRPPSTSFAAASSPSADAPAVPLDIPGGPSASPAPAPTTLPATASHSADKDKEKHKSPAPAPAKVADLDKDKEKLNKRSPAPAPAAAEMKASSGSGETHEEMNGGKKAGVVVGAFTAAAVVGLGAFVWRKRRANIRRARYAEYSARLELV